MSTLSLAPRMQLTQERLGIRVTDEPYHDDISNGKIGKVRGREDAEQLLEIEQAQSSSYSLWTSAKIKSQRC